MRMHAPLRPRLFFFGWWIVLAVALANFAIFAMVGQGSLSVLNRTLVREFGWQRGSVSLIGSLILFFQSVLAYLAGVACDRFGPRPVLILGIVASGLGMFVAASSDTLGQFYLFSGFLAIGEICLGFTPTQVLVSAWFTRRRGLALSLATMGVSLGGIAGPVLMEQATAHLSWRAAFVASGLVCLFLATPMLVRVVRNRPQELGLNADGAEPGAAADRSAGGRAADGLTLRAALRTRTFWGLAVCQTGMFYAVFAIAQHWVLLFTDQGVSPALAARMLTVYYAVGLAGRLVWGPLFDRFRPKSIGLVITSLMASMVALLTFGSSIPAVPYVYAVVFGFCYGGFVFMMPLLVADFFGRQHLGRILGVSTSIFAGSASVSPAFTGLIHDLTGSYRVAFLLATLAAAAAVVGLALVRNERERTR